MRATLTSILFIFALLSSMAANASTNKAQKKTNKCDFVTQQIKSAEKFVGRSSTGITLHQEGQAKYIVFIESPSRYSKVHGNKHLRWQIIERSGKTLNYCTIGRGTGASMMGDMHLTNPFGKYGMPGSGYPRCAGKLVNGVLPGSLDIRMWANKELGDSLVFYFPNNNLGRSYTLLFSTDAKGEWIMLDSPSKGVGDTCYFDRGGSSSLQNITSRVAAPQ